MNLLNKLGRFVLSSLGVAVLFGGMVCFSSCELMGDLMNPTLSSDEKADVTVTLRLDEAFQEKAHVRVNHDGTMEDYWYYMITRDFQTDAKVLLEEEIKDVLAKDGKLVGNVGTNRNVTFEGLAARTEYRVLAALISPDGNVASDVAELKFVTKRDPAVFETWPAWEISYKERRVAANDANLETDVFECAVSGDTTQTYIPCIILKSDYDAYYKVKDEDKKDNVEVSRRKCFEDYIDYRNSLHVKWSQEVKRHTFEYTQDRMMSGDYILFMIGVDAEGELTGYYAETEFKLKQETPTKEYEAWAGSWTLKGETLNKNEEGQTKTIEYKIDIVPAENNLYFELYGYDARTLGGLSDIPYTIPMTLRFEKSSGDVYVVSEQLPEPAVDNNDMNGLFTLYDFFAYGTVEVVYQDVPTVIPVDIPNMRIACFSMTDANHAVGKNTSVSIDLYGENYNTEFVAFNYYYIALGQFNYVLSSAYDVLRTNTITLVKN